MDRLAIASVISSPPDEIEARLSHEANQLPIYAYSSLISCAALNNHGLLLKDRPVPARY
jgi:hypothetical protein